MKYHVWLKQLNTLYDDIKRCALDKPYDPDAHKKIIFRLRGLLTSPVQRQRRRPWSALISVIILLIILLLIVWQVLSVLYTKGIQ